MFSSATNASKLALIALCHWLAIKQFEVIDCQVASEHLFTMGAEEITRARFLQHLDGIDVQHSKPDFSDGFEQVCLEDAIKNQ